MALTVNTNVSDISSAQAEPNPTSARPDFAVVFYTGCIGQEFMTRHKFNEQCEMGIGELIDGEQLNSILTAIDSNNHEQQKQRTIKQLLPDNILFDDFEQMIWFTKAQRKPMWFRFTGIAPFAANVIWTPMLWSLNKKSKELHVYALENDERPTMNTPLYRAPLPNVNDASFLCQGSAQLPLDLNVASIPNIEATLLDSAFSHWWSRKPYASFNPDAPVKESLNFWRKRHDKDLPVELSELIPMTMTVSDLIM